MLSQENIDKLEFDGIYSYHDERIKEYVFEIKRIDNKYRMQALNAYVQIVVDDENFNKFEYIVNKSDLVQIRDIDRKFYRDEDVFEFTLNVHRGTFESPKVVFYILKGTTKCKDLLLSAINKEIDYHKYALLQLEDEKSRILNDGI